MNVSPATAGFLKGLVLVIVLAVVDFLGNAANLNGILSPSIAVIVAAVASGLESHLKASSGGTTALFGAISVRQ